MTELKSTIENSIKSYSGAPAIDLIRDQLFLIAKEAIDKYSPEVDVLLNLETENECFTGKISISPIPVEMSQIKSNIRVVY